MHSNMCGSWYGEWYSKSSTINPWQLDLYLVVAQWKISFQMQHFHEYGHFEKNYPKGVDKEKYQEEGDQWKDPKRRRWSNERDKNAYKVSNKDEGPAPSLPS